MRRGGGSRDGSIDRRMTRDTRYVELHCHSAFSMLDGAALPETLMERARELGYPALALTDHGELVGAVRFAQAGEEFGVSAIIGAELTVGPRDTAFEAGGTPLTNQHLVLLAETREGYGNLSTLITLGRMRQS